MALMGGVLPNPKPPSNNSRYQPMFGGPDPYKSAGALSPMLRSMQRPAAPASPGLAGGLASQYYPVQQATGGFGTSTYAGDIARAIGGMQTQPGAVTNVIPPFMPPPQPGADYGYMARPPAPLAQNTGPAADAARLLGGAVAGNPFIQAPGQQRLGAGYVPDLNSINPAFFRYSSPVIQQALQGLYQSVGMRPEDLAWQMDMYRPPGLG